MQILCSRPDFMPLSRGCNVVRACFHRRFQHRVLVPCIGTIFDITQPLEPMRDRTFRAQIAAIFGEGCANGGGGAVAIVG